MTIIEKKWVCCQIGAREYYAVPRALHRIKKLEALITDAWISPRSITDTVCKKYFQQSVNRYHSDLDMFPVRSFNPSFFLFEFIHRRLKTPTGNRNLFRNNWFQKKAIGELNKPPIITSLKRRTTSVFAYSYAAINLARFVKDLGCQFVLGQIDPGLEEENIVRAISDRNPEYLPKFQRQPESFWISWLEECKLADQIIVNSEWSRTCLTKVGVPLDKIFILPLAYQSDTEAKDYTKSYPDKFTSDRPMRALFMGQLTLRKGIAELKRASTILKDEPIEFWLVGYPVVSNSSSLLLGNKNIRWIGRVSENIKRQYYQNADVFIFPTFSDGFGLTQLEAQSWKLPIIASKFCGDVVTNKHNGLILDVVNENAIAQALKYCLHNPDELMKFSNSSIDLNRFSIEQLRMEYTRLFERQNI